METLMDNVIDFFNFYKKFDFESDVVFPYLGRAVAKREYMSHFSLAQ
jgi:hypothetical protein